MALDAQYHAPGSMAAAYLPAGGAPLPDPIRVIRSRPDRIERFAGYQVDVKAETFEIRCSDVPAPAVGDVIDVRGSRFSIEIDPVIDVEGLSWMVLASPIP